MSFDVIISAVIVFAKKKRKNPTDFDNIETTTTREASYGDGNNGPFLYIFSGTYFKKHGLSPFC